MRLPRVLHAHRRAARHGWNFDELVSHRVRLRKGEVLVRTGDRFARSTRSARDRASPWSTPRAASNRSPGYHIAGDMLGAGASTPVRTTRRSRRSRIANSASARSTAWSARAAERRIPAHAVLAPVARDRARAQGDADARHHARRATARVVPARLADRYRARGYSSSEFVLRMTREEIGSHLGLKLETVSRLFSRFHRDGADPRPGTRREAARPRRAATARGRIAAVR